MKKIFIAIVSIAFLGSCAISKTAKNNDNTIAINIDLNTVVNDKVKVEVNPKKITEPTLVYNIPAIVPGTYAMSDYGKFVSEFKAIDYDGNLNSTNKRNFSI